MGYERIIYTKGHLCKTIDNLDVCVLRSPQSYTEILQGCVVFNALEEGRRVHTHMSKRWVEMNTFTENKLINMYGKCGSVIDAKDVFEKMTVRNVISWTSIIGGYARHGFGGEAFDIFLGMKREGSAPNRVTFLCILDAFDGIPDLDKGKMVHFDILDNGLDHDIMIGTALINMYGKCGSIEDASSVFDAMNTRDVVSCTAMISVYTQQGHGMDALQLFERMECEGIEPNEFTFTSILRICASLVDVMQGKRIHIMLLTASTCRENGFVGAALVNMYAKCGSVHEARCVFDRLKERDVTSWTALITGYAHHGCPNEALGLFQQMQVDGLEADVVVGNALIDLYSKCGNLYESKRVFSKMLKKDIITWSTLISGYAQQGFSEDAVELYWQMLNENIFPDKYTVSSVLAACANLTALVEGMKVHAYIMDCELDTDVFVRNALVNLYAKCGTMEDANTVFYWMITPELESWNAMILAYGQHGYGEAAYDTFQECLKAALKPDEFTFSGVLGACVSLGMLSEGKKVHNHIIRTGFEVNIVVGNALIDMYATCGALREAHAVFSSMFDTDLISWSSMIGGWAQHGYGKQALSLYHQMRQEGIRPDEFTFSSLLIGCSHAGLVEEGWYCFGSIKQSHAIVPTVEHYASMVDLLGRSGCLHEGIEFIHRIPIQPHCVVWMSLLAACRSHDNVELAERAAAYAFDFGPRSSGAYVLLSNMYAMFDVWNQLESKEDGGG